MKERNLFVDIRPDTYNIDIELVESAITDRTKAIIGVDVFGQPAEWDVLEEIASRHGLYLIEDSCESLGSEHRNRKADSFGDAGIFAFYPNKQVVTGEGGVVVTDREEIAILARSMRNQGRGEGDTWLQHTRLGYNYRISDINCALGISQLQRLDIIIKKREEVSRMYSEKLTDVEEIITPCISKDVNRMNWFVYVIRLSDEFTAQDRDRVIENLRKLGIETRNYFSPIHLQPFYIERFGFKRGDFPVTEAVSDRTIALPFYTYMTEEDIDTVVDALKSVIVSLNQ